MTEVREALLRGTSARRPTSRLLSLLPVIDRRTPRRSMVARFRRLMATFVATALGLFLLDLRDGVLDFAPLFLLLLGFVMASQYGALAHAGFSWRDMVPRRWRSARPAGGSALAGPQRSETTPGARAPAP